MTKLGLSPTIHATATVRDNSLGNITEVGPRTSVIETTMGDYSYVVNDSSIVYHGHGKFCSIAAMTRSTPATIR